MDHLEHTNNVDVKTIIICLSKTKTFFFIIYIELQGWVIFYSMVLLNISSGPRTY